MGVAGRAPPVPGSCLTPRWSGRKGETEAGDGSFGRPADGWVSSAFSGRAGSVAKHLGGDGWERSGPNAFTAPDPRWDAFLEQISGWVGALPPAPVSVEWDEDDPEVVERLLAALWRDGAVVLTGAVPPELCDAVLSEMEPCTPPHPTRPAPSSPVRCPHHSARHCLPTDMEAARPKARGTFTSEGSSEVVNFSARVGCLPSRSEASHGIIAHPALLKGNICDAFSICRCPSR